MGVEKREALRIRLTLEEILLDYQERFGEEAEFKIRRVKRFMTIKVELTVGGQVFNPLEKGDEENIIQGILAGIGLAPSYAYRNGKNYIVFIPKKKPLSSTVKMGVVLAVDAIIDFPATACNVSGWQLTMIHVADTLNMLDEEALHKNK